jgi:hypothetical protein
MRTKTTYSSPICKCQIDIFYDETSLATKICPLHEHLPKNQVFEVIKNEIMLHDHVIDEIIE